MQVFEGAMLLLEDSRVHGVAGDDVGVQGTADIQDCVVEDGQQIGIGEFPTGKVTISGTKVRRNRTHQRGARDG